MAQEIEKKSSFLRSIKVVAWSFIGIRSSAGYRDDLAKVNPLHVVLVGLVGALLLIVGLMSLVEWVVSG
jgi:amino acid transporter